MSNILPIKPGEATKRKVIDFPDAVLESFNQLIAQNLSGTYSTVLERDVVALMVGKGLNSDEIYKNHWLDVEGMYRAAGWKVTYDKPGYNESYPASFEFSKR